MHPVSFDRERRRRQFGRFVVLVFACSEMGRCWSSPSIEMGIAALSLADSRVLWRRDREQRKRPRRQMVDFFLDPVLGSVPVLCLEIFLLARLTLGIPVSLTARQLRQPRRWYYLLMPQPEGSELDAIRERRAQLKAHYLQPIADRPRSAAQWRRPLFRSAKRWGFR